MLKNGTAQTSKRIITIFGIIILLFLSSFFSACLKKKAILETDKSRVNFDNFTDQISLQVRNSGFATLDWEAYGNQSWFQLSKTKGDLDENQQEEIIITAKRDGMEEGIYEGQISLTSNGGSLNIQVVLNNGLFEIRFFNASYTPVDMRLDNDSSAIIPASQYGFFTFVEPPETVYYNARTSGVSSNGSRLGYEIIWDDVLSIDPLDDSPLFILNVPSNYFYLEITNNAPNIIGPVYVNADSDFEFRENVLINAGAATGMGYYNALKGGEIRIYYDDMTQSNFWFEGEGYFLSNAQNQLVSITNIIGIDTLRQKKQGASKTIVPSKH